VVTQPMNSRRTNNLVPEKGELRPRVEGDRLSRMCQVVSEFARIHRAPTPPQRPLHELLAAMKETVDRYGALLADLNGKRPAEFSILGILRREHDELTHSRLLAWLLDPRGNHKQGSLFVSAFAAMIGLDTVSLSRCRVCRERVCVESIIDIMVWRESDFLIFIENKVWSPEGEEQLDREFRDLSQTGSALCVPEDRQLAVFLTPSGRMPISGEASNWTCVSYGEIADRFRGLLPEITDVKVRIVLEDWLDVISGWG